MKRWPFAGGLLAGAGWVFYNGQAPKPQVFGRPFIGTPGQGRLMAPPKLTTFSRSTT